MSVQKGAVRAWSVRCRSMSFGFLGVGTKHRAGGWGDGVKGEDELANKSEEVSWYQFDGSGPTRCDNGMCQSRGIRRFRIYF